MPRPACNSSWPQAIFEHAPSVPRSSRQGRARRRAGRLRSRADRPRARRCAPGRRRSCGKGHAARRPHPFGRPAREGDSRDFRRRNGRARSSSRKSSGSTTRRWTCCSPERGRSPTPRVRVAFVGHNPGLGELAVDACRIRRAFGAAPPGVEISDLRRRCARFPRPALGRRRARIRAAGSLSHAVGTRGRYRLTLCPNRPAPPK